MTGAHHGFQVVRTWRRGEDATTTDHPSLEAAYLAGRHAACLSSVETVAVLGPDGTRHCSCGPDRRWWNLTPLARTVAALG